MIHREGRIGANCDISKAQCRSGNPWSSLCGSWRQARRAKTTLWVPSLGTEVECYSNHDGTFEIGIPQSDLKDKHHVWFSVEGSINECNQVKLRINTTKSVMLTSFLQKKDTHLLSVNLWSNESPNVVEFWDPSMPKLLTSDESSVLGGESSGLVQAPMPGKVVRLNYEVGDSVNRGDIIVVLESMKMENPIRAEITGILTNLNCGLEQIVDDGHKLATIGNA